MFITFGNYAYKIAHKLQKTASEIGEWALFPKPTRKGIVNLFYLALFFRRLSIFADNRVPTVWNS